MEKYYMIHGSLFEHIGKGLLRCIASNRKDMIGVMEIKPDVNKPYIYISPAKSKAEAIYWMKQDAYWDNLTVYTEEDI